MPQGKSEAVVGAFAVDENWTKPESGGGEGAQRGRKSEIDVLLESIAGSVQYHGQWIGVARYNKAGTAKGAINALKSRLGGAEASGFTFETRFAAALDQYAIVAKFDPASVTEEGKAQQAKDVVERKAKEKAARVKREQEKAKKGAEETTTVNAEAEQIVENEELAA